MQVFAKTLQSKDVNVRRQVFKSYVALGLLGLRPIIDLTGDPDEALRRDALSVIVSYLYGVVTKSGELGVLSEDDLRDVKTRFATAERGELRFAAARIFEVEASPVAFYDLATRQLLPTPAERDLLSALEDPEAPELEDAKLTETAELSPEEIAKREQERKQKRYRAILADAEKLLQKMSDADPQVRAAAVQGASRLAMSESAEAFYELADRAKSAMRQWITKELDAHFGEVFGEEGNKFLLSLVDEFETVDARLRKHEKALNLGRPLDEAERRRLEERSRREFEHEAKKRHLLMVQFFERLEKVFEDYSALASNGKDPLDDLLLRTARSDWDEVLSGARSLHNDGGRKLYLGVMKSLSFADPEATSADAEYEKSLKERLQAEYDAKRQDAAKAIKSQAAEEERNALAKGGRFLVLMLAMLFRIREEREKAKDRARAAYLLAALTHSDPKVRQSAIEPLSQRHNREQFRKAADAFIKRVRVLSDEERAKEQKKAAAVVEVLPPITPLGWPALRGTKLEEEVFLDLSSERFVTFWHDDNKREIETWRFDRFVRVVREKYEKVTEPERLAELAPLTRPSATGEAAGSEMWRDLAFGTYVGLLRPTSDVTPKVREAVAQRIGVMARSGLAANELAAAPLRNALADPSSPVRKAALEALSRVFNAIHALGMGLASEHPDMGLYALSQLRRRGMKLESTQEAAPAPVVVPAPAAPAVRRFEFVEGNSAKFWECSVEGSSFVVTYGRLGTAGQRKEKDFPSPADAHKERDKKVAEKLKEGYVEFTGQAAPIVAKPQTRTTRRWVEVDAQARSEARALVIAALDNPHAKVRRRAQELLSEFYPEGSQEPIRFQVQAERADVRDRALADLLSRDVKDPAKHAEVISGLDAASALSKRLPLPADAPREVPGTDTRPAIALSPAEIEKVSSAVLRTLSHLLTSHQEATQRRAAAALSSLGRVEAISALALRVENDAAKSAAVNAIFESIARLARGGRLSRDENKAHRESAERPLLRELDSQGEVRRKLAYEALLAISGRPLLPEKAGETRENTGVHNQALALRYLSAAALRTRFDDLRLDAIARLHRLRDEAGYQVLADLLLSSSDAVRAASLRALGEIWITGGSPRRLLDVLSTPSAIEGVNATKVEIAALLSSPVAWAQEKKLPLPTETKFEAADHERIFETLAVSGLNSSILDVKTKAMRALGALGDPRSLQLARLHLPDDLRIFDQPLQQALDSKRLSTLRAVAAEASGDLLERAGLDAKLRGDILKRLVILLRDTTVAVRNAAFFSLGRHLDDRILPLLDAALLAPTVRRFDPLVLRAPEGEGVEVTLSHDELFALRAVAARTVAARRYSPSHIRERLADLMKDNDTTARRAAADALKSLAGEDTEEFLLAAYKSPHADLRLPAIQGLIDGGRPSVAMKLLGESKDRVTELFLRLLRRDSALLAREASQVLEDRNAPASQGAVAAQVLGSLAGEVRTGAQAWLPAASGALASALSHSGDTWLEAARTAERPGLDDAERKAAHERAQGAARLFGAVAVAFSALVDASASPEPRLAAGAAKWLMLEGPRNAAPSRDVALRAIRSSRISTQDPEWPAVQKALQASVSSVDPEQRRLAAQATARLNPSSGLGARPSDALAAGQLVSAYVHASAKGDLKAALLSRFSEADGVAAVLPALLQSFDTDVLVSFLKDTRGRGVRDPHRDTDRASKAIHRRRLAAVHALSARRELAGNATLIALLSELAKDRVEPEDLRKAAHLAARRLRKWKRPAQLTPPAAE
jgi:predicted DNA-binding WGR domain protein/HEAT repeat protein